MIQAGQALAFELVEPKDGARIVDLGSIVPIGRIEVQGGVVQAGISIDGGEFAPITGDDAGGATARYVRLECEGGRPAAVCVRAGEGLVARACPYWTDSFKRYENWTGGDGIFCYNLSGVDAPGNGDGRTMFVFSDTLFSRVDPQTLRRQGPVVMTNNTYALLDGEDPQESGALRFFWNTDDHGKPDGVIRPNRDCYDFEGTGESFEKAYFWLQDGVVLGDRFCFMPSIITEDKSGPQGFQFRGLGVCIAEAPVVDGTPDFTRVTQHRAQLWRKDEHNNVLYGACILPWLREAGFEDGDGYVYVYGHMSGETVGCRSLCVARVLPEHFTDWTRWRFFDGEAFAEDIARSRPLLEHISCEMSVTPILSGKRKGQFLAVFQYDTKSSYVAYAYGQTPWGPFTEARKVYRAEEEALHPTAYLYNAKVHNHLSYPDKVLASYNVNATDPAATDANGHLYLPRFVLLEDTTTDPLERLFSDAFTQRVGLFRALNRHARPGGAVFVGDSLIQEFPVEELLGGALPVYNRGIGADTTTGLLKRLDESVLALRPSRVFLLMGTNDIAFGASDDAIEANHGRILCRIARELPDCRAHLISLLPVNSSGHPKINSDAVGIRTNERIAQVNARLRALALQHGATFIDAHGALTDSRGLFALPYTREGLHLSPQGNEVLAAVLRPYLIAPTA